MAVINPVSTFLQPNYSGDQPGAPQTGTGYPLAIDSAISALKRAGDMFAPHASSPLAMTVSLDSGHVWAGAGSLVELNAQTTGVITAPVTNPRCDRIVISRLTGVVSIVAGAENAVQPSPPAIPNGVVPVAYVVLQTTSTIITNAMIYDERDFTALGDVPGAFGPQTNLASATTTDLGTVASQNVQITGTTTITGLGSSAHINAPLYLVKFAGALTLTDNATSLILPGAANIVTASGDAGLFEYLGSGNWKCQGYFPASGLPLLTPSAISTTPSNPTGTSSTVMMGLAVSFTPNSSGRVMITVIAVASLGGAGSATMRIRRGTGVAPANGAAVTGTATGNSAVASSSNSMLMCQTLSTMAVGVANWIDVSLAEAGGITVSIINIIVTAVEV